MIIRDAIARGWSNEGLIYYYIRTGRIPVVRSPGGQLIVCEADLRACFGEKSYGLPQKSVGHSCYLYQNGKPVGIKLGALKKKTRKKPKSKTWRQMSLAEQTASAPAKEQQPKRGFFARIFGL